MARITALGRMIFRGRPQTSRYPRTLGPPSVTVTVTVIVAVAVAVVVSVTALATAESLDKLALDRWSQLREVERYQLQVAERYYNAQNWKAALAEYEKYVTLYEQSEAASFAQLKWGLCQISLRQSNTAIKDGFQSVLDYWPDSQDATIAAYYIGHTYKNMGQVDKAQQAFEGLVQKHAQHEVAVYALVDLVDIATGKKDLDARAEYWKHLTFDATRNRQTVRLCEQAARQYAEWCFRHTALQEGANALATTYSGTDLYSQIAAHAQPALTQLAADPETLGKAQRLADEGASWMRLRMVDELSGADQAEALQTCLFAVADLHAAALQDAIVAQVFEEIDRRCGTSDTVRGRLAAWQESRHKYELAYSVYRQFEDKPDGLSRIAASYRMRELPDAAIDTYRQLTAVDADNQYRWTAEIAATYREAGKFAEAISIYRELMQNDPTNNAKWLWLIGTTHRDARQWKEAIGVLRQCTNVPQNLIVMAECQRHLKQWREALVLYNQVAADERYAAFAAYQIAVTWEESGKKEEAIKAFQQVCKRYPKSSQASSAHARLQTVYNISVTLGGALDNDG